MLDGEEVAKGSAHEVKPGARTVEFRHDARAIKTWFFEVSEPDCPAEPTTDELAETGVPTGLIAGSAALLIAVGAALLLVARRRSGFTR